MAGAKALAEAGVDPARIGLMINTSVSRAHLEPSTAVAVHHTLGLPTTCLNFDLANACLGFVNGMQLAATMIDAGQIDYALVVDGEGARYTQEVTIDRLAGPDATGAGRPGPVRHPDPRAPARRRWCSAAPTSTREGHRFLGGVDAAGTEHHDLCVGRPGRHAHRHPRACSTPGWRCRSATVGRTPRPSSTGPTWTATSRTRSPQVHTARHVRGPGHRRQDRVPLTFPPRGNMGPAAVPFTLASEADSLHAGDRVLLLGIGSGLNASCAEIVW